jgi:hypothetical protein
MFGQLLPNKKNYYSVTRHILCKFCLPILASKAERDCAQAEWADLPSTGEPRKWAEYFEPATDMHVWSTDWNTWGLDQKAANQSFGNKLSAGTGEQHCFSCSSCHSTVVRSHLLCIQSAAVALFGLTPAKMAKNLSCWNEWKITAEKKQRRSTSTAFCRPSWEYKSIPLEIIHVFH